MQVIDFSKADCSNCYRCVRECPVKAIRVKDEQAGIVDSLCIGCGRCLKVCPKNAKQINSELSEVKTYIKTGEKVAVSVAPSFISAFDLNAAGQFVAALKKLGFSYVELTAMGAAEVSKAYYDFYIQEDGKNYISTCCPAANYLIQKYYPHLIDNMIQVVSPMVCHGKILKKKYGQDCKTVFIGPCLAKKMEAIEEASIDSVLTFDEVSKWFESENIRPKELEALDFDSLEEGDHLYPTSGGIIHSLDSLGEHAVQKEKISVDGIRNCMELLKDLEKGSITNTWIEMNLCLHGCINGPAMPEDAVSVYLRKNRVKKYAEECEKNNEASLTSSSSLKKEEMHATFKNLSEPFKIPMESDIQYILGSIGKTKKQDELNCGACGYNTCREKAAAVYNGMAEKNMCLPYMRQRAETLSNIIFDVTPNVIFILNEELEIIGFNPAAEDLFGVKKHFAFNRPASLLMDVEDFKQVQLSKENIIGKKIWLKDYDAVMLQTVLYLRDHKALFVIMADITADEKREKKLQTVKMNTLHMAQEVIDKQMRVAQEIASLLGETTAETKVILTKLKKIVEAEEDGLL